MTRDQQVLMLQKIARERSTKLGSVEAVALQALINEQMEHKN